MPATGIPFGQQPFRLLPRFHARPWGVTSLAPWFDHAPSSPVGEAWFTGADSGTDVGAPLADLLAAHRDALLGELAPSVLHPLLLKWIFTADRLSVQVHPDDAYAMRHHGSPGKTEAWHVVDAREDAAVGLGFRRALDAAEAREAAITGAIEHLLAWHAARRGDTFLVPAGTVHAIGAGLTLVEIQEPSDVTYRLYDYGRPRPLHLDHGLAVAVLGPYEVHAEPVTLRPDRVVLATCAYFTMERLRVHGTTRFEPREPRYHLLTVVEGTGLVAGQHACPGATWFVPATTTAFLLEGAFDIIVIHPGPTPTTAIL